MVIQMTGSNGDDQKLYKEYLQCRALPAVSLTFQKQTLNERLFVEAIIQNVTCEPQSNLFVDVNFKCMGLFQAINLTQDSKENKRHSYWNNTNTHTETKKHRNKHWEYMYKTKANKETNKKNKHNTKGNQGEYDPNTIELLPNQTQTVLFQIALSNPTDIVNLNAFSVGQLEVQWHTQSRRGIFLSDVIQRRVIQHPNT